MFVRLLRLCLSVGLPNQLLEIVNGTLVMTPDLWCYGHFAASGAFEQALVVSVCVDTWLTI